MLYSYYNNLERTLDEDYGVYVFDIYDEEFLDILIQNLFSGTYLKSDKEKIEYVASFVQYLPYKNDSATGKSKEYPRYPLETLFHGDGGGDCEDKAILAANILSRMGFSVALLRLPQHMVVGINLSYNLSTSNRYIENYYFLETTSKNYELGNIPKEYESETNVTILPISQRPLLLHTWKNETISIYTNTELGDFIKAIIFLENIGSQIAENITIIAGFFTDNEETITSQNAIIQSLSIGTKKKITFFVNIPKDIPTNFSTKIYYQNNIVDMQTSVSSFP
jgi:hypothetical protein